MAEKPIYEGLIHESALNNMRAKDLIELNRKESDLVGTVSIILLLLLLTLISSLAHVIWSVKTSLFIMIVMMLLTLIFILLFLVHLKDYKRIINKHRMVSIDEKV